MKKCATACVAFFFLSFHAAAQTYFECDFSDGIPAGCTLIDNDLNEPSADMKNAGFSVGTPWIVATPKGETNSAACSTSWYASAAQSDDWLITPPLTISGEGSLISWRAMASDKKYRDGYAVYVSTSAGTTVDDFDTANPLFSVEAEEAQWTSHSISLDAYRGQTITIAFVNNSYNKSRLFIDDIYAGVKSNIFFRSTLEKLTNRAGDIPVSLNVYTLGSETISSFDVTLEYDQQSYAEHFDTTVVLGTDTRITLQQPLRVSNLQSLPYTISITDGQTRYALSDTLTSYQRKILGEEVTGTWCSWCVRGIVALAALKQEAADRFIGIATHSGDVMANDYVTQLSKVRSWSGIPTAVMNRQSTCDPSNMGSTANELLEMDEPYTALFVSATPNDDATQVAVRVETHFAADNPQANYRLAFSVIENNVHHAGDTQYSQNNAAYSGGGAGEMGGYEDLPTLISSDDMWFQEVARGYLGDFNGIEGSIPAQVVKNEPVVYEQTFNLPDGIDDINECELVAILLDAADGHVLNAESVALGTPAAVTLRTTADAAPATIFTPSGTPIPALQRGLNIVRLANGTVRKVVRK